MLFPRFWRDRTKLVSGSFRAVLAPTHPGWQITIPTGGLLPERVWRNGQPAMRQIYASTEQKPGQRNAFKSVRGSNHPVLGPRGLFTQTEALLPVSRFRGAAELSGPRPWPNRRLPALGKRKTDDVARVRVSAMPSSVPEWHSPCAV
jgi:hypothetical protein